MTMEAPRVSTPEPNPPPAPVTTASPGSLIRAARESSGLSLDDLASMIKLARSTLEALERDDFQALLEPVYVRGYYRKCAKVLGLDEKALLDGYAQRVTHKSPLPPSKLRLASGGDLGSTNRLPVPTAVLVAVLAILACALLWFLRGAGSPAAHNSATSSVPSNVVTTPMAGESGATNAEPQQQAPAVETPTAPGADAAAVTAPEASAPATAPEISPSVAPTPAPAAQAASTPPADEQAVVGEGAALFKFKKSSWLRIKDADGRLVVRAEFPAGSQRRYGGKQPLDVFIGAAADVTLEYEGKAIDLAPYTRENKTAWLVLPLKPQQ
ncbi:cytoskeleton protein RodZ [Solimonas aquatica]|uniref:Cytoskeleton protein RodZ n=1 Tax=Solimonas aquatica TaxID=489703 RepID=A0A1H9H767_9GAMM|nr:RodZ domain-containing protein [Solimonas aquatica]SEQ58068.1 cytoskeleton protein RodZ [Solimonas aquatica]